MKHRGIGPLGFAVEPDSSSGSPQPWPKSVQLGPRVPDLVARVSTGHEPRRRPRAHLRRLGVARAVSTLKPVLHFADVVCTLTAHLGARWMHKE